MRQYTANLNKLADMSPTPFHLYVWPQRLLMLAPAYASAQHRHHVAQIGFGLDGPVVYESPQTGPLRADLLLVPPDTLHAHPAFGATAVLYLEPESSEWARFPGRESPVVVSLPFNPQLRSFARCAAAGDTVAAQWIVDTLLGQAANSGSSDDELVSQVCALIGQRLDGPITLAALANAVHRSPSRLAHRFREATGVPLRRYVLWRRLRTAVEVTMRGASLTDAAHVAGFADSAHLSRTFRSTFGIAPSFMFERSRFSVTFCESTANN
ncbi:MAG: AraC family transcriptional regulator [Pseudomonadota bacterium]|jgi:AraC-like DNA-binding protein|uniref:helix-turn-helix transcriptional regulator n=2 Tax=Burkholderiales TaxID=80840 RepID=UPI0010F8352E|nr:AraC family transcriptional regulator [Burkholderia sp. 4M9327F10]